MILSFVLLSLLSLLKLALSFTAKPIMSAFEDRQAILPCLVLITDDQSLNLQNINVPMFIHDFSSSQVQIKEQSQLCKNHIISSQNSSQAVHILTSNLLTKVGKTALIIDSFITFSQVKNLTQRLKAENNLAIFIKRKSEGYTIYHFHFHDERKHREIELTNLLLNDKYKMSKPIFINDELHGVRGKQIKVTSFERNPFAYKNAKGQFEGYEISLMKDLAESLEFTWDVVAPTDGGKWGEIKSDGSATGLVGDIKV